MSSLGKLSLFRLRSTEGCVDIRECLDIVEKRQDFVSIEAGNTYRPGKWFRNFVIRDTAWRAASIRGTLDV